MEDEIERLVVGVRADTAKFSRDVDAMRAALDGPLASGVERAGRAIEGALSKAVRTGSLGFEDLRKVALSVLDDIAASAVRDGVRELFGGGGGGGGGGDLVGRPGQGGCCCTGGGWNGGGWNGSGGVLSVLESLFGGAPGRATGGPVSPARPYWVGERGPELFVPTASGSIVAAGSGGGARDVRVSITVQGGSDAPQALAASSRQVARAVKAALSGA